MLYYSTIITYRSYTEKLGEPTETRVYPELRASFMGLFSFIDLLINGKRRKMFELENCVYF